MQHCSTRLLEGGQTGQTSAVAQGAASTTADGLSEKVIKMLPAGRGRMAESDVLATQYTYAGRKSVGDSRLEICHDCIKANRMCFACAARLGCV